eukprot:13264505-Alexandrium_andersonii.AAC.1
MQDGIELKFAQFPGACLCAHRCEDRLPHRLLLEAEPFVREDPGRVDAWHECSPSRPDELDDLSDWQSVPASA